MENKQQTPQSAVKVYFNIKERIQELYRQIWEADEKGENFSRLHEELLVLESILKTK